MNISRLFASNILWRGGYLLSSLLVTVLLARYLASYTTGWLFYLMSWLSFFLLVASFSMESSITYFVSTGQIGNRQMQSFAVCWTLIITCITIPAGFFVFQHENEFVSRGTIVTFTVFFITGNLLITFFNALFYTKQQYMVPNFVFIASNTFTAVLLLYGIYTGKIEFMGYSFLEIYFFTYLMQGAIIAVLYTVISKNGIRFFLPPAELTKKIFIYSSVAFLANLFFFLVTRIDYWLLDYFHTERSALGNYIQASRLVQLFQLFPAILASSIFPIAAAGYSSKIKEGIMKLSRIIVLGYTLLVFFLAVTGKWLFPFIFGDTFQTMYYVFLFLTPGLLALSVLSLMAAYFAAINKIRWNVISTFAGLLVIIAGDVFLIKDFGVYGAAFMSSIGYSVCFTIAYFYFKRETTYSLKELIWFQRGDISFISSLISNLKQATK